MADKYILSVTAGPTYKDQKPIPINTEETSHIQSSHLSANLRIRIQNYRGLPQGAPKTSPYFSQDAHTKDLYSIYFSFTPKSDINAHDLVFGNDFDHPIRDKLPPGFQQAFQIMKWFIDPGLYGDVQADEPYLYGPLLSSMNVWRVGPRNDQDQEKVEEMRANEEVLVIQEGGDGDGKDVRKKNGIPEDAAGRKKHFLTEQHLKDFTFEAGREYSNDFFNPYVVPVVHSFPREFANTSIHLPATSTSTTSRYACPPTASFLASRCPSSPTGMDNRSGKSFIPSYCFFCHNFLLWCRSRSNVLGR